MLPKANGQGVHTYFGAFGTFALDRAKAPRPSSTRRTAATNIADGDAHQFWPVSSRFLCVSGAHWFLSTDTLIDVGYSMYTLATVQGPVS